MIEKHNITALVDVNHLFEYMKDLKLNLNKYEDYRQMLVQDIQNKNELPNFNESVRKILNALVTNITDNNKQEKIKKFLQNEV